MNSTRTLLAPLALLAVFSVACGEEVGSCDDPSRGQDTVISDGLIQFGGQAIINQACAGCHGSGVTGASRQGAPAGLDFDLLPVEEPMAAGTSKKGGDTIVELQPETVKGLRERQRLVFEERNLIWQQVKDGVMPPDGLGARFRELVKSIADTSESEPCTRGPAYKEIGEKQTQDVLRNWLACGAPIVESQGASVTRDKIAGVAGYQFKMCGEGGEGGGGEPITIELLQEQVIDSKCATCHGGAIEPDLSTADKSYEVFTAAGDACMGKPYVDMAGKDLGQSYLHELLTADKPSCPPGIKMPQGSTLSSAQLKLFEDWIAAGAPRE